MVRNRSCAVHVCSDIGRIFRAVTSLLMGDQCNMGNVKGKFWIKAFTELKPSSESGLVEPKAFQHSSWVCSGFLTLELFQRCCGVA